MGDASPLSAEPVGVYDVDMSGMTEDVSNMSKKSRTDIPKEALVETIQKKLKGNEQSNFHQCYNLSSLS